MLYFEDEDDFQGLPFTLNFNSYEVREVILNEKEMQSENENFIQEKNITSNRQYLTLTIMELRDIIIHYGEVMCTIDSELVKYSRS